MRKLFTLLTSICLLTFLATPDALAQTGGINCGGSVAVSDGVLISSTGPNAGGGASNNCFGSGATDARWYTYTPAATGTIDVESYSGTDTRVSIYSGTCIGGLTCLDSDDDGGAGYLSLISGLAVTAGTTYHIEWDDRWSGADFTWDITFSAPATSLPGGINCTNATVLPAPGTYTSAGPAVVGGTLTTGCQDNAGGSLAEWYRFTPASSGVMTVSSCGSTIDTQLGIFAGPCAGLTCLVSNDDGCGLQSTASTPVTAGNNYYIQWDNRWSGSGFEFELSLAVPDPGDVCSSALPIACGATESGSTSGEAGETTPFCGTSNTGAPGNWYTVTGTGFNMTAELCGSSYDTKIHVMDGTCTSLACVAGNDDFCGLQSSATWSSVLGTTYYIYVFGFGTSSGAYDLTLTCAGPPGDLCDDAISIACGTTESGTTVGATAQVIGNGICGTSNTGAAGGLWYTVTGNGFDYTASLCGSAYDTKLQVFSGTCAALTCVGGNDDFCGIQSEVTWTTAAATTYYIYVYGFFTATGAFDLELTCGAPVGDVCGDAISIACGATESGDTGSGYSGQTTLFCGTSNIGSPGVWYTVTGTGFDITASLCGSSYDTKIQVFDGTCAALNCIGGNDDFCGLQSELTWTSVNGTVYYIYVYAFGSTATGAYDLTVTCAGPQGDICDDAIAVTCGSTTAGSTVDASDQNNGVCGTTASSAGGIWFTVPGTGGDIVASLCNAATTYDTKMQVFSGTCAALVCVGGNDDSCGLQSEVTWTSASGTDYFIYVYGFVSAEGAFELDITCPPPANDLCANALPAACDAITSGSTANGTAQANGFCGTSQSTTSPGVWYTVTGTGFDMTASLCGLAGGADTRIQVFSGTCAALVCVGGDDDFCAFFGESEVTWTSTVGTTYYVYVYGWSTVGFAFDLEIDCPGPPTDICDDAVEVFCGTTESGSNVGASVQSTGFCGTAHLATERGVWYYMEGTGGEVTADLCGSGFDTKLQVFRGSCAALVCVGGNDDFCGLQSSVTFDTDCNETYYFYIFGFSGATGAITLNIACTAPANDLCSAAEAVTCGSTTAGTNIAATAQNNGFCGTGGSTTSPGSWFSVTGTGGSMTATLCGLAGGADTRMQIFSGTCAALTCVGGNDDFCAFLGESQVTWASTGGTTYYIYVYGWAATGYCFDLTIDCSGPPNDLCADAEAVTCGSVTSGTNSLGTAQNNGFCGTSGSATSPGVWYTIQGNGNDYVASLCGLAGGADTRIQVFSGSCAALTCVDGDDDFCAFFGESEVQWSTTAGTDYYIYVYGWSTVGYAFDLSLTCLPPANDLCDDATPVSCFSVTAGTTIDATPQNNGACGSASGSATNGGVWYSIAGTGNDITASLCTNTAFDTKLQVFSGSCAALTCVGGNDDSCGLQSEVEFPTVLGTDYYIYVFGFGAASGTFDLTVTCDGPPANDLCDDAIVVNCGDNVIGATNDAAPDVTMTCGTTNTGASGIWYTITGTGGDIVANLCGSSYDTKIQVFEGTCAALVCVTGNDDATTGPCAFTFQSEVTWTSTAGTDYYIYVYGWGTSEGDVALSVECPPPANDLCDDATVIACGGSSTGTTVQATSQLNGTCGTTNTGAPGVWYTMVGTGGTVTASLCSSSYDTKLQVFEGTCAALTCVDGNDDACALQSEVTFVSTAGTDYFFYVYGFGSSTGNYQLDVTCPPPVNDLCDDAVAVNCGDVVTGSTVAGTAQNPVGFCGVSGSNTSPGVWYSIVGTGGDITASLCGGAGGHDARMQIMEGPDCLTLSCTAGDDDFCSAPAFGEPEVTWTSTAGTDYYIYVFDWGTTGFSFDMTITCPPPANDLCDNAEVVNCGDVVSGTRAAATAQDNGFCGTGGSATVPGVWYQFAGNDGTVTASLCGGANGDDTRMQVFEGPCASLVCVDGDDDFCSAPAFGESEVTWVASAGTDYYIYVYAWAGAQDAFDLTITCPPPVNDLCDDAIAVTCGDVVSGTTTNGTAQNPVGFCGVSGSNISPGVWYSIVGTGGDITASMCGGAGGHDARIQVMEGPDCLTLSCTAGDDDFCSAPAFGEPEVTWSSTFGTQYYIYVFDWGVSGFAFDLTISCPPPANDLCDDAVPVTCESTTGGITFGATAQNNGFCGTGGDTGAGGVWYSITGDGSIITASLCTGNTTYDSKIQVFEGTCAALTCVDGNDDACGLQSEISWTSVNGTDYFIYVYGFGTAQGILELEVTCFLPTNDLCDDATDIFCGNTYTGQNTLGATAQDNGDCGDATGSATVGGLWYAIVGSGATFTVNTCGSAFDTKIQVFSGTCAALTCVGGNDDFCGLQSQVTWASVSGTQYYIYVYGFSGTGAFDLEITCTAPVANDDPCNAIPLAVGIDCNYATYTNENATLTSSVPVPSCQADFGMDVWFTAVVPASGVLAINTQAGGMTDGILGVYTAPSCAGPFTEVGCDELLGNGLMVFEYVSGLTPGETVYIRMGGFVGFFGAIDNGTFDICIAAGHVWTGAISGDYSNSQNWFNVDETPTAGEHIVISPNFVNQLDANTGDECNNLYLANGSNGVLDVPAGQTFNVHGDIIGIAGAQPGTWTFGDGVMSLAGTTPQQIISATDGTALYTFTNLQVDNAAGASISTIGNGAIDITESLILTNGTFDVSNGDLVFVSDPVTGTAYLNDFGANNGGLTGNVTSQRWVASPGYHHYGFPIENMNLSQLSELGLYGADGVQVTASVNCSPDSLGSGSNYGALFSYSETGPWNTACSQWGWYVESSGTVNFNGEGMAGQNHPNNPSFMMEATGVLNCINGGSVTTPAATVSGGNNPFPGADLYGNPMQAPFLWGGGAAHPGMNNFLQLWNEGLGTYTPLPPGSLVPIWQGFIALATSPGATITFDDSNKAIGDPAFTRVAGYGDYSLDLSVSGTAGVYDLSVGFANELWGSTMTLGWDNCCEAYALAPATGQPHMWTEIVDAPLPTGPNQMQINMHTPLESTPRDVPMGFDAGHNVSNAMFTITASNLGSFPIGTGIVLEDLATGTMVDLMMTSTYTFSASGTDNEDRFIIHFQPASTVDIVETVKLDANFFMMDDQLTMQLNMFENLEGNFLIMNAVGQSVETKQVTTTDGRYVHDVSHLATGMYIVRFVTEDGEFTDRVFKK